MVNKAEILVVDDELPVCKSVARALEVAGYGVDTALSAEEALEKMEGSQFDVIITDLMMPGLSGMDLLKAAAEQAPSTRVIMITGYPSIKSAVEAVKLGAFDYIPKPFTPNELRSLVSRALRSRQDRTGQQTAPPTGVYCIPENSWTLVEENGNARVGVHHLFLASIDRVTSLELPGKGEMRYQGEACVRVTDSSNHVHKVWTPVSGRVILTNESILEDETPLLNDPYGEGWLLVIEPTDLYSDLNGLRKVTA